MKRKVFLIIVFGLLASALIVDDLYQSIMSDEQSVAYAMGPSWWQKSKPKPEPRPQPSPTPSPIPEPSTLALIGTGAAGVGVYLLSRRRHKK